MQEETGVSEFPRLLEYLKVHRGFDFSAYKVSSLMRRIQKRMKEVGVDGYAAYTDYLEVHPHEFGPLFDTVLINVTGFFRDSEAWQYVAETILPRLLGDGRSPDEQVRMWSAGCATGEEAYTLAMLLAEALGEDGFRRRVKIYATDVDENALTVARQGTYDSRQVEGVPAELLEKYFDRIGSRYVFRNDLRRCLIFGRLDLIQDAAISRLDLLVCRNTLMYFNSDAQAKIVARFHFALKKTGYLFMGKAETLLTHSSSFKPVELKHRIFARSTTTNARDRLLAISTAVGRGGSDAAAHRQLWVREAAFDAGPAAQIVVDHRGFLVSTNEKARELFGLRENDLGRPFQDLEMSYRPAELRSRLEQCYESRAPVNVPEVEWRLDSSEVRFFEVQIVPLIQTRGGIVGASIAFVDLTQATRLRSDLERTNQELETAYEELQSANEELETTNEELQSTVEELETTNEELQSANEELETMNEELQSTNEELRTLNDQVQQRSDDLDEINGYFESVLTGLRAAVAVLDRSLHVQVWSEKAQDLWGLRQDEVLGRPFLDLDIGLPAEPLRQPLRETLASGEEQELVLEGVNRRGKPVRCRVLGTPLHHGTGGMILLMEEMEGA